MKSTSNRLTPRMRWTCSTSTGSIRPAPSSRASMRAASRSSCPATRPSSKRRRASRCCSGMMPRRRSASTRTFAGRGRDHEPGARPRRFPLQRLQRHRLHPGQGTGRRVLRVSMSPIPPSRPSSRTISTRSRRMPATTASIPSARPPRTPRSDISTLPVRSMMKKFTSADWALCDIESSVLTAFRGRMQPRTGRVDAWQRRERRRDVRLARGRYSHGPGARQPSRARRRVPKAATKATTHGVAAAAGNRL